MTGRSGILLSPPDSSLLYQGTYDPLLVALSVAVAVFAAAAALGVARQVAASQGLWARRLWIGVGGLCLGAGTWAMHFVGMLALSLPCGTGYDPWLTLASMGPATLAGTLAMTTLSRSRVGRGELVSGGLLLGSGIGAMHYTGMAALRLDGLVRYDAGLFVLSLLVAVGLAILALWLKMRLQPVDAPPRTAAATAAAVGLGLAVTGMHYTAMAAAYFIRDGEAATEPGAAYLAPTFLAAVVLVVTGAIIMAAIVATVFSRANVTPGAGYYALVALLILGWTGVAWAFSSHYSGRLAEDAYRDGLAAARREAAAVAGGITYELAALQGVAALLAEDSDLRGLLWRFGRDPDPAPLESRRQRWSTDSDLADYSRRLAAARAHLNADVIYVLTAAGDCVAASNSGSAVSFIGGNFADREYFRQARDGGSGRQYAYGRVSRVPGLYFSWAVIADGGLAGVVVVKRDVPHLQRWTRPANAFVSDVNGVIVLSPRPVLDGALLPNAVAATWRPAQRAAIYGRDDLSAADLRPWRGGRYPGVMQISDDDQPLALASEAAGADLAVHVARPLPDMRGIVLAHGWLFMLLAVAGSLLILAVAATLLYLRAIRQAKDKLMRQAEELARSNEELERFTEILAHHIQEPVRLQSLYAQRLERSLAGPLEGEARLSLDFVLRNCARLRHLLRDAQSYLALERHGRTDVCCDATAALTNACRDLRHRLEAAGVEIAAAPLPRVRMAQNDLARVFRALLDNALQYRRPDRGLRIRVDAQRHGAEVVLSVRDNGIGIAPQYREAVFGVFVRLQGDSDNGGTGIGLAMVRKLIEHASGRIWADDGDDGGCGIFLALAAGDCG